MSSHNAEFRSPTKWERQVMLRLLEPDFPGRDAIRTQIDNVLVKTIDENGSLELRSQTPPVAQVTKRIPTEAEAVDGDGTTIHYLLHVAAGIVAELEIYKDDSSRVRKQPRPDELGPVILG